MMPSLLAPYLGDDGKWRNLEVCGQVVLDFVSIDGLGEPGLHLVVDVLVHQEGNRIGDYGRGVWPLGHCYYVNSFLRPLGSTINCNPGCPTR